MSKKALLYIVVGWCVLTIVEFYFIPYFFVALLWVLLSLGFLAMAIVQIMQLLWERNALTKLRIVKALVFSGLFFLTFKHSHVDRLIERADWHILYDRRMAIVEKVKRKELRPLGGSKSRVCELPYKFPVVSKGGNYIMIRGLDGESVTISFWIVRNYFASTSFVYTTNPVRMKEFEKLISVDADNNWKMGENWYRIVED